MEHKASEIEAAIADCRREMAKQIVETERLKKENYQLRQMLLNRQDPTLVKEILQSREEQYWKKRYENSLSGKLSKPYHLFQTGAASIHSVGLRETTARVIRKIRKR